jgi:3-oxoacyl-[acyl-carrier protein] reductase
VLKKIASPGEEFETMNVDLRDRVAIVTGAGQGIGEGIAKVFAQSGAKVVVATRSADNGQQTVDDICSAGGVAMLIQCDVGRRTEIERMVAETAERWGRLDIAIHNAAIFPIHSVAEMPDEVLDQTLAVNMKAGFWLTQAALPFFRAQGGGRIIFTSSVTGPTVAMPGTSNYAASKGGMNAFIRTAALELARENITVNGVEPGYIMTQAMGLLADEDELKEMASLIPIGKIGVPEDIAYTMLFLASDQAAYITGQTIIVDGGSTLPESPVVLRAFYEEHGQG